jgi:hypothetical protein
VNRRLDHVIGGDAEIPVAVLVLDYLENGLRNADPDQLTGRDFGGAAG